jgi:NADH-quinone oxidoreductase subunit F
MNANTCYIYIRGEYIREREALQAAIDECYDAGLLGKNAAKSGWDFDLYLHHGAGAYICGEETALLESLEGKKGMPRMKPPFPAGSGLYGCPTTVNNVESIAVVPTILRRGAAWFAASGGPTTPGPSFSASRAMCQPCVVEEAMSIPLKELLERHCGGVRGGWNNLKAVIPGGSSVPLLPDTMRRCDHGFRLAARAAVGPGHGGGDRDGPVDRRHQGDLAAVEVLQARSCGQCTPCREGTGWMMRVMDRLVRGEAEIEEIDMLLSVTKQVEGHTICALGDAAAWPIQGLIRHFRDEIEDRIKAKRTGRDDIRPL